MVFSMNIEKQLTNFKNSKKNEIVVDVTSNYYSYKLKNKPFMMMMMEKSKLYKIELHNHEFNLPPYDYNLRKLESYLHDTLYDKFNIEKIELDFDPEDEKWIFVFKVGDMSANEISNLSLKIREKAYYYSKKHELLDVYNSVIFLLRR